MTILKVSDKATPIIKPSYKNLRDKNWFNPPYYKLNSTITAEKDARLNNDPNSATWHKLVSNHVDSFNWFATEGLNSMPTAVAAQYMRVSSKNEGDKRLKISVEEVKLEKPTISTSMNQVNMKTARPDNMYPSEARQRRTTYGSNLEVRYKFELSTSDTKITSVSVQQTYSEIPIMLGSKLCHLSDMSPFDKVHKGREESREPGGYFICNGNEKVIRHLCMPRRNIPMATSRKSYANMGKNFTTYGSLLRSVDKGLNTKNLVIHYLRGGDCTASIYYKNIPLKIPAWKLLIALQDDGQTPSTLINEILRGEENNLFLASRTRAWLTEAEKVNIITGRIARATIGRQLRGLMKYGTEGLPEWWTFEEFGQHIIDTAVAPHLGTGQENNADRLRLLCHMVRQSFGIGTGKLLPENPDSTCNHEVLLPGHLIHAILVDRLDAVISSIRLNIRKKLDYTGDFIEKYLEGSDNELKNFCRGVNDPAKPVSYLMATGNLKTGNKSLLALQQDSGLCVVADRINMVRFISHFRAVHRGRFFQEMRTTTARKLLPEAWGFLCPDHSPDGGACGILNHMTSLCEVSKFDSTEEDSQNIIKLCLMLGMRDNSLVTSLGVPSKRSLPIMLDGKMIGWLPAALAKKAATTIRVFKALGKNGIPQSLEVVYRPLGSDTDKQDHTRNPTPGIFLINSSGRLIRPVWNLMTKSVEMIGSLEQVWLKIAIEENDFKDNTLKSEELVHFHGPFTHQEVSIQGILSVTASMTPFSYMNQSARNMYQCGMLKQTMGIPSQAIDSRADTKAYKIQTPQAPLDRNYHYDHWGFDNYPTGTNSIVALISYTGEDMEDAMCINKAAVERGLHYGTIFMTKSVDLMEGFGAGRGKGRHADIAPFTFGFVKIPTARQKSTHAMKEIGKYLDQDGLPFLGRKINPGEPFYCYVNNENGQEVIENWKASYSAIVHSVKPIGNDKGSSNFHKVNIMFRMSRSVAVGDKFAARHGQKGTCSRLWHMENLPFTESGMIPDMIFNPHGITTRMTVGMLLEGICGKAAALHGECYDTSSFIFNDNPEQRGINYFGKVMEQAGYDFYGRERMFSGTSGQLLTADIYIGSIFYQRLKHMVDDKAQVRVSGPVDQLTQQPVKGRRRGGGLRLGEMEKDAIVAHGAAAVLNDRWMECSDGTQGYICSICGSILSTHHKPLDSYAEAAMNASNMTDFEKYNRDLVICRICGPSAEVRRVNIPFVLRYLVAELAAMNVKLNFRTELASTF